MRISLKVNRLFNNPEDLSLKKEKEIEKMQSNKERQIYTVGHSTHTIENFIKNSDVI